MPLSDVWLTGSGFSCSGGGCATFCQFQEDVLQVRLFGAHVTDADARLTQQIQHLVRVGFSGMVGQGDMACVAAFCGHARALWQRGGHLFGFDDKGTGVDLAQQVRGAVAGGKGAIVDDGGFIAQLFGFSR